MITVFAITTVGFAGSLAVALWRLLKEVRATGRLRLELRSVIDHAREVEAKYKRQKERNDGYRTVVQSLKEGVDKRDALLKKHGISARTVLDGMLSKGGGET